MSRTANNVEQDRGNGAAEQRTPIDAGQHNDGGRGIHREGERQQDGNTVWAAQSRKHANENAEHKPDHHQCQRLPGQQNGKTVNEQSESFHGINIQTGLQAAP
jgi:hypothetical protein